MPPGGQLHPFPRAGNLPEKRPVFANLCERGLTSFASRSRHKLR
jgi:hypothetical protein